MLVKSRKHFCTSATVIALIITNIMYLYQEFNSGTPQGSNLDQGLDCIVINVFSDQGAASAAEAGYSGSCREAGQIELIESLHLLIFRLELGLSKPQPFQQLQQQLATCIEKYPWRFALRPSVGTWLTLKLVKPSAALAEPAVPAGVPHAQKL